MLTSTYFFFFDSSPILENHAYKKFPLMIFFLLFVLVAAMMTITLIAILFSHTNQICKNLTTIDLMSGAEFSCFMLSYPDTEKIFGNRNEYDIGNYANFVSIFGENPAYWCLPIKTYSEKVHALPNMSPEEMEKYGKKKQKFNVDEYIQRGLAKYDITKLQYSDILLINNIRIPTQVEAKKEEITKVKEIEEKLEEDSIKINLTEDPKQDK